jgi:hypothetical protein
MGPSGGNRAARERNLGEELQPEDTYRHVKALHRRRSPVKEPVILSCGTRQRERSRKR